MIDVDQDFNIFYLGGSGGFIFLHWLLLLDHHWCHLPIDQEIFRQFRIKNYKTQCLDQQNYHAIKDNTWPDYRWYTQNFHQLPEHIRQETTEHYLKHCDAKDIMKVAGWYGKNFRAILQKQWVQSFWWKSTEHSPDNNKTIENFCVDRPRKLYFTCNDIDSWISLPGTKILLYTDLKSQLLMSKFKKAWAYHPIRYVPGNNIAKTILKSRSVRLGNKLVHEDVIRSMHFSKYNIKLQELISSPSQIFALEHNTEQKNLLATWFDLHPKNLLDKVGLDPNQILDAK